MARMTIRGAAYSTREKEVLSLLAQFQTPRQIAGILHITPAYIYLVIRILKIRFNVETIAGIVMKAIQEKVIDETGKFLLDEDK